jgi:hypothetical protein
MYPVATCLLFPFAIYCYNLNVFELFDKALVENGHLVRLVRGFSQSCATGTKQSGLKPPSPLVPVMLRTGTKEHPRGCAWALGVEGL